MTRAFPTPAVLSLAALALSGCAEPMIPDSDVIRHATEPAYTYDEGGRLAATSCRADRPSTYSGTPSACQRDVVFARQVANPSDLVRPQTAGRPMAGPVGAAADRYLYGVQTVPWATAAGQMQPSSPATAALPAPTDGYYRP